MKEVQKALVALLTVIIIISFVSGLEVLTGKAVLIDSKGNLRQEDKITEITVFPKTVMIEKVSGFIIKDKIGVEVIPGSAGAYKEIVFYKKGGSRAKNEFNLKCEGFKCRKKVIGYQGIDKSWETGDYVARVKDAKTRKYVYADFRIENNLG